MLNKMSKMARKSGQTSVEYILIIGVVVAAIALFGNVFKQKIQSITGDMFKNIESNIKSNNSGG